MVTALNNQVKAGEPLTSRQGPDSVDIDFMTCNDAAPVIIVLDETLAKKALDLQRYRLPSRLSDDH